MTTNQGAFILIDAAKIQLRELDLSDKNPNLPGWEEK
jgi:hypothetical protein